MTAGTGSNPTTGFTSGSLNGDGLRGHVPARREWSHTSYPVPVSFNKLRAGLCVSPRLLPTGRQVGSANIWHGGLRRLSSAPCPTYTPTLTGRGERMRAGGPVERGVSPVSVSETPVSQCAISVNAPAIAARLCSIQTAKGHRRSASCCVGGSSDSVCRSIPATIPVAAAALPPLVMST